MLKYLSRGGIVREVQAGSMLHEILEGDQNWKRTEGTEEPAEAFGNINTANTHEEAKDEAEGALEALSKQELRDLAKSLDIKGFSKMSVNQLRRAIEEAE